jgi:hypothetical protein
VRAAAAILGLGCGGALASLASGGCVDHQAGISGTQSIQVDLVAPADPGSINNRLENNQPTVTVNLTAYDAAFEVDTAFDHPVHLYVQYLGTLTPLLGSDRLPMVVAMTAGQALGVQATFPAVYGPTTLWVDDAISINPTYDKPTIPPSYATGTSPALWFRDAYIADIQRPAVETALDALSASPLENKQIAVNSSRYGAVGRLVVTSVFSQGYTVSDVACSDAAGTPPCTAQAYDHVEVFSFSAPRDQNGRLLRQGQVIDGFSGGISEFNGLTEIGFPVTFASDSDVDPARLPTPVALDPATWFKPLSDPNGIINFERNEAAPISITGAVVCMLDDDYDTFKQWKLDPSGMGGDCSNKSNVLNVITAGVIGDLDPATLVGKTIPRVVGVVRPVELPGFNVWIIFPRSADDLTLPPQ